MEQGASPQPDGFVSHAAHGPLGGVVFELIEGDPGEVVGFWGDGEVAAAGVADEEADVVVVVGGDVFVGGDAVDVEVEDVVCDGGEGGEAGFFEAFLEGDGEDVAITVGMTAGLEPEVEFAVVGEEGFGAGGVEDPGGGGDMPLGKAALEAVGVALDEVAVAEGGVALGRVAGEVLVEEIEEGLAGHEGVSRGKFSVSREGMVG
jgi:hypothetical protein